MIFHKNLFVSFLFTAFVCSFFYVHILYSGLCLRSFLICFISFYARILYSKRILSAINATNSELVGFPFPELTV